MAWKRMFSLRAPAAQVRTPVSPSDSTPSARAKSATGSGTSTSTGAKPGTTSVRSRERSFSETAPSKHDGSSTVPSLNASINDSAGRPRSLDLSSATSERPPVRASYSAESLLEFNHPDDSESTLSLSLSYHSLHGHERPRTPVTVAASSKSADMLPRPPPKSKPKRHVNTSFPYFVTPLVLTTANPYIMPPTPPSSPTNTKPDAKSGSSPEPPSTLPRGTFPPVREAPVVELQHPSQEAIDEPPPAPSTIFQKITGAPRKRLVSRPSADGLAFASSASTLASFPRPVPAHFDGRPTSAGTEAVRASRPPTGTAADAAPRPLANANANAGADERVKIAVAKKARVDGEARETRDVGEVLPRLRMLRAR